MVTAKTCLRVIVVCMAIFAGLQLILESFDVHTTYKYTLPSSSKLQKAAGSHFDHDNNDALTHLNLANTGEIAWNTATTDQACTEKYHISPATFGDKEEIHLKYTADGITLYD